MESVLIKPKIFYNYSGQLNKNLKPNTALIRISVITKFIE